MKPMIEVIDLSKSYEQYHRDPGFFGAIKGLFTREMTVKLAVDQLNFVIPEGACVAFIGGNGAGKSTTIKMLSGILTPTQGQIWINGVSPHHDRIRNANQIGVIFGQRSQLIWDITPMDAYRLIKHIYDIPDVDFQRRFSRFSEELRITHLLDRPVRQLSLGERMRCEFLAAFLHNPRVIFLDEPTIGLDVAIKARIRDFIKEINKEYGTTIVLTSHDMADMEHICNRFMIIDGGKLIYDGNYHQLQKQFGNGYHMTFSLDPEQYFELPIELVGRVHYDFLGNGVFQFTFDPQIITTSEIAQAMFSRYTVKDMQYSEPNIEHVVQRILERRM